MSNLRAWYRNKVLWLILILLILAIVSFCLYKNYDPVSFIYSFLTNIVATIIGIVVSIFVTLKVINPLIEQGEEKRNFPLRKPILTFWEHHLTSKLTMVFLIITGAPQHIKDVITGVSTKVMTSIEGLATKEELDEVYEYLNSAHEPFRTRNLPYLKEIMQELLFFTERMHTTIAALPHLFKQTPEVAVKVNTLLGNLISGLKEVQFSGEPTPQKFETRLDLFTSGFLKDVIFSILSIISEIKVSNQESTHRS